MCVWVTHTVCPWSWKDKYPHKSRKDAGSSIHFIFHLKVKSRNCVMHTKYSSIVFVSLVFCSPIIYYHYHIYRLPPLVKPSIFAIVWIVAAACFQKKIQIESQISTLTDRHTLILIDPIVIIGGKWLYLFLELWYCRK